MLVLDGQLSPGQLVAFNMLAGHVVEPILRLAQVWQDFQHTLISCGAWATFSTPSAKAAAAAWPRCRRCRAG